MIDLDLGDSAGSENKIKNGDHISIGSIINENRSVVSLVGHVYNQGQFTFTEGMRISDLLNNLGEKRPGLDTDYAIITRIDERTGHLSAINVELRKILTNSKDPANIKLNDRDILRLFSIDGNRSESLKPLTSALIRQARAEELPLVASISGARLPGVYPITENMSILDLINSAGGLTSNYADLKYSVLVREDLDSPSEIFALSIDLRELISGENAGVRFTIATERPIICLFSE